MARKDSWAKDKVIIEAALLAAERLAIPEDQGAATAADVELLRELEDYFRIWATSVEERLGCESTSETPLNRPILRLNQAGERI